jgi:hypothetical protein
MVLSFATRLVSPTGELQSLGEGEAPAEPEEMGKTLALLVARWEPRPPEK